MQAESGPPATPERRFHHELFVHETLPSGRVLVRDGSVSPAAARALAPALEAAFARHPALAVAVARRIRDGLVAAHGAFVLHPKGFHRGGRGAPAEAERFDAECDAADLGVAVVSADAFAAARGEAILNPATGYGALALLVLSLDARRRGLGRVVSIASATLEASHEASLEAEQQLESHGFRSPVAADHARAHLGFDLEAADLHPVDPDALARRSAAANSTLCWNAPVWGAPVGFAKYDDRGAYHWKLYATHDAYRRRADALVAFLAAALGPAPRRVLDVGAGDALFAGLFARIGHRATALDPEPAAVALARETAQAEGLSANLEAIAGSAESMPFADASFDAALLLDVIEHLRNPVRALAEIRRVLAPGGALLVATPAWRFGARSDPVYHLDEYRDEELARQLAACGFEVVQTARIRGAYDDLVALARRRA